MTHYSRPHVVFEKLKSRHGSIFDENYDEIQKNLQSFDLVSAKREWRLKRHWPLEGYTFILAPRELNNKMIRYLGVEMPKNGPLTEYKHLPNTVMQL